MNKMPNLKHGQKSEMIRRWFIEDKGENQRFLWDHDEAVVEWMTAQEDSPSSSVNENLKSLSKESAIKGFKSLMSHNPDILHEAGMFLVQRMSPQKRSEFLEAIKNIDDSNSTPTGETVETTDDSSENGES